MNFVLLLFIINQLNLNVMLKYALVENALALIEFDSSSIDSISRQPLVKEVSKTVTTQGKTVRSSILEESKNSRIDSAIIHSQETTDLKSTENIQIRKFKVSKPQLRLYSSITIIFLLAALGWMLRKKITNFFCLFGKNSPAS